MIRPSVRSAGLAILLSMNGCGIFHPSGTATKSPGLNVAEAALQGGAGEIALRVSDGVLHDSPNNIHALEVKGDALSLLGQYDEASTIFQALLAKDPNSIRAITGLGRLKLSKDPAAAEALFLAVLKRDPQDLTALNNVGISRDLQGRHADAQIVYRQALAINPDLDSAKINLALSLGMSGQGPAAIELLKTEASLPGAPVKLKHDYAVILAMAGRRAEAELILGQTLPPDEVHRVLDSATGTHTNLVRDTSGDLGRTAALRQIRPDDGVPPDVVQVPEVPAEKVTPANRVARTVPISAGAPLPVVAQASIAANNAPPPAVVRPQPVADGNSDAPTPRPVTPVAAAVAYQRPLSLPIRAEDSSTPNEPDAADVAMPKVRLVQHTLPLPIREASVDPAALPTAPPPPPVLAPAPLPPAYRLAPLTAHVEPPAPELATPAPEPVSRFATRERDGTTAPAEARVIPSDPSSASVQFAAAASEASARSFWSDLVRRFPEALGDRAPIVIRYDRGGMVFWRVRTEGFGSASEAQALCARMRAGGQDCFVPRS